MDMQNKDNVRLLIERLMNEPGSNWTRKRGNDMVVFCHNSVKIAIGFYYEGAAECSLFRVEEYDKYEYYDRIADGRSIADLYYKVQEEESWKDKKVQQLAAKFLKDFKD